MAMRSKKQKITIWLKSNRLVFLFSVVSALIIIFIAVPISTMILQENLTSLYNTFNEPYVRAAIWLSIYTAFISTVIGLLLGIPLGYVLARKNFFGKCIIQGIVDTPVVIPHTVAGIALLVVFSTEGIFGAPLSQLELRFIDAVPGIVVAMLFVSVPFVINSAKNGFQSVDPRLENIARSLGASQSKAFFTVSLPLASRNILTGAVMAWARAVSEFGALVVLAYYPMVASTLIYDRFTSFGLYSSRPIAVLLILICLLIFVLIAVITSLRKKTLYKLFRIKK